MDIVDRLPSDIVRYIIPFTYQTQPKELLEQIKSQPRFYRFSSGHKITVNMMLIMELMGGLQFAE